MVKKYPITVRPNYLNKTKITIYGEWFNYITGYGVYLSANKPELNTEVVDLYSEDPKLVVKNPYFYGIPVNNYHVVDNNTLEFNLPEELISANYDIIICNPAGYTKASSQIALNVITVVGVFEYKQFISINGNSLTSIEDGGIQTIRKQFVHDFASALNLSIDNQGAVVSIDGNNIVTIERFLTSN